MLAADNHRHLMFNPVTPDVSPPPPDAVGSHLTIPKVQFSTQDEAVNISSVTSVDIQEMEQVRRHLQNMLKSSRGFDLENEGDYDQGQTITDDQEDGGDHSMSSVDTAAFLQKLLPNSSPLEELKVHFGNQLRMSETLADPHTGQQPGLSGMSSSRKSKPHHQHSNTGPGAERSIMAENSLLREHLDRERFRRKHCEQQIQELHGKLLEVQQDLAVAVSSERKKDVMVEQLDKTLAKVVEGWKRHENEKVLVINTLKQEREVQETSHQRQQEMLLQFEKELSQAVEALTKEQERASQAEREKQLYIEKQKAEREQLLKALSREKDRVKQADEEKLQIIKEKEQAQHKYMETQKILEEISSKNREIQAQFTGLEEEFTRSLTEETKKLEQEKKITKEEKIRKPYSQPPDSYVLISSLQKEVQRLEMELDTATREKESLKMEISLMEARFEASRAKEETDRQAELERQMNQRLEEIHEHMSKSDNDTRDSHRKQVHELNRKHKEELQQQLGKFHEELKKKETKIKTASLEYEERLYKAQDHIGSLANARQQLENERQNTTIRMQNMMQAHCEEALRLLNNGVNKSPVSTASQGGTDSRTSGTANQATTKWTQPTSLLYNTTQYHEQHRSTSHTNYTATQSYMNPPMTSYSTSQYPDPFTSDPKSITYKHITAPVVAGYSESIGYPINTEYPESGMFSGSYLGGDGGRSEMAGFSRSGVEFVPLKSVEGDHDVDSVISGLRGSPANDESHAFNQHHGFEFQSKVLSSGGSGGGSPHTLLEQDLEDTQMTIPSVSPEILQTRRTQGQDISEKLQEQEQRQTELNHYVKMLLKRSPGQTMEEGDEPSGLMLIPRSSTQVPLREAMSPVKPDSTGYAVQSFNTLMGSNSVTKDQSQASRHAVSSSVAPAFTKTTVPTPFSVRDTMSEHSAPPVPHTRYVHHQSHPHTPPRRDRDPSDPGVKPPPPLTPQQMSQLSRLVGLVGGREGMELPSAEQLFDMLKGLQRSTTDGAQTSHAEETSHSRVPTSRESNTSRVKRSLDSSFPSSRSQKLPGPSVTGQPIATQSHQGSAAEKSAEQPRSRPSSSSSGPSLRSGVGQDSARQQAPAKTNGRSGSQGKVDRKSAPNPKQGKSSTVWR